MNDRSHAILRWELLGAAFIVSVGSALHFVYGWSGGWKPVALVAAVNESVWEHLKLAFWPGLLWALLAPADIAWPLRDRLAAKGCGLLVVAVLIVTIFKGYTVVIGHNLLPLDIATFAAAILSGQLVSALAGSRFSGNRCLLSLGLALLIVQILAYSLLSYFPLQHWLFLDGKTGLSGLP